MTTKFKTTKKIETSLAEGFYAIESAAIDTSESLYVSNAYGPYESYDAIPESLFDENANMDYTGYYDNIYVYSEGNVYSVYDGKVIDRVDNTYALNKYWRDNLKGFTLEDTHDSHEDGYRRTLQLCKTDEPNKKGYYVEVLYESDDISFSDDDPVPVRMSYKYGPFETENDLEVFLDMLQRLIDYDAGSSDDFPEIVAVWDEAFSSSPNEDFITEWMDKDGGYKFKDWYANEETLDNAYASHFHRGALDGSIEDWCLSVTDYKVTYRDNEGKDANEYEVEVTL